MTFEPRRTRLLRRFALATGTAAVATLGAAALAPAAQAAPFTCSAASADVALGGQTIPGFPAIADGACTTQDAVPAVPANPLLSGFVVNARTSLTGGPAQRDQVATATGGVADLELGSLSSVAGISAPAVPVPAQLQAITIPTGQLGPVIGQINAIPVLGPGLVASIGSGITVNTGALIDIVAGLPNQSVLDVSAATATASARCVNGAATLDGSTSSVELSVLGQRIPTDQVVDQALDIDTLEPVLQDVDVTQITLPSALNAIPQPLRDQLLQALQQQIVAQIQQGVAAIPPLPVAAGRLRVTPGSQERTATSLTQRGPRVQLELAGQPVADVALGRATVGSTAADCALPAPAPAPAPPASGSNPSQAPVAAAVSQTAAQQLLACGEQRIVLTNVIQRSDRVALFGVADAALRGRTVTIRSRADRRDVARATVLPDGTFKTTAPLPPRRLRSTNQARYEARVGTLRSLDLKLQRRMQVSNVDQANGTVTVRGKLVSPLPVGGASVLISRRVSCNELQPLRRVKADRNGNYEVTVPAPVGESSVVYRLESKVRNNPRNRKTFRTYTLPQGIDIA